MQVSPFHRVKIHYHSRPVERREADAFIYGVVQADVPRLEQLWAKKIDDRLYQVCSIPFFTYNVHLDDLVEVEVVRHNINLVSELIRKSAQYTLRIWFNQDLMEHGAAILNKVMSKIEGIWESKNSGLVAVSVGSKERAQEAYDILLGLEDSGALTFETGWIEPGEMISDWTRVIPLLPDAIYAHPHPVWHDRVNSALMLPMISPETEQCFEQLWTAYSKVENAYQVCCVPFYVYDITLGDWLDLDTTKGNHVRRIRTIGHTTLRIWFYEVTQMQTMVHKLLDLGCFCEQGTDNQLIGVSVPDEVSLATVSQVLQSEVERGTLSYEQSSGIEAGNYGL